MNTFIPLNDFSQFLRKLKKENQEEIQSKTKSISSSSILNESPNKATPSSSKPCTKTNFDTNKTQNDEYEKPKPAENEADIKFTEKDLKTLRRIKKLDIQILVQTFLISIII